MTTAINYKIGNKIQDEEHSKLIELILKAEAASQEDNFQTTMIEIVNGLEQYVHVHFTVEEELMRIYGYPGFKGHLALHAEFTEYVQELKAGLSQKSQIAARVVVVFLKKWLTEHILVNDKKVADFLSTQGLN